MGKCSYMPYVCACIFFTDSEMKPEVPWPGLYGKLGMDQAFAPNFHISGTALGKFLLKWTVYAKGAVGCTPLCNVPSLLPTAQRSCFHLPMHYFFPLHPTSALPP